MAVEQPKQYLPLAGRTVIDWALQPFIDNTRVTGLVVVTAVNDAYFVARTHARLRTATGGPERADSVRAGLTALAREAADEDWVLVHDAARPCLHPDDLDKLIESLGDDAVGGLLATPLADTLKQADARSYVRATVPREGLWRALTPQMFRYGLLRTALERASRDKVTVTDEASAVELLGHAPRLVAGRTDNIKITVPEDLIVAEAILKNRDS
jgi:2-C-methyl-D-erythritol 4-phosphate cytidylyltransferase